MKSGGLGDETVGIGFVLDSATARSACSNAAGNSLPRLSARRIIPAQAVGLKKNRGGRAPVSRMEDSEDAAAPLRNSGILSVSNPVASKIPALLNEGEEGGEITVFVTVGSPSKRTFSNLTFCLCASGSRGQETGDVLENHPAGAKAVNNAKGDERQVAAVSIQADTSAGDAEVLTG